MAILPVVIGLGGINPAGRTSFHHGYNRMIFDALNPTQQATTLGSLACLMGVEATRQDYILQHTLIRKIEKQTFDGDSIPLHHRVTLQAYDNNPIRFKTKSKQLPADIPVGWIVRKSCETGFVEVEIREQTPILVPGTRASPIKSCGQLPTGFDPNALYPSRNHPKGLAMTVYAASDAINSLGIGWATIRNHLAPDQIGVYAGSGMSQLDSNGFGNMMQARLLGKQVTPKNCPLGFAEMPADFVNSYITGSVGTTGCNMGACATFLYNLRQGIEDIKSGRRRLVIVGNSEAALVPEIFEGYGNMGALATDAGLLALDADKALAEPDYRRACRPFSHNCGFTLSESAQFFILCDDVLALELGATIYGAVPHVFVHADGFKKSITSPGIGNYLTMGKSAAAARSILGDEALQQRAFVVAHGTSTPQNRVTESRILNETAKVFGIDAWPVAANKCYVGHSLSPASGDQLAMVLGTFAHGIIPGIKTIDEVADDVEHSHLKISRSHHEVGRDGMDVALLNSKGFGGNNATGCVLAPHIVKQLLSKRHGQQAVNDYLKRNEQVMDTAHQYDQAALNGDSKPIYLFGHDVISDSEIAYSRESIKLPGFDKPIKLNVQSEYFDWLND